MAKKKTVSKSTTKPAAPKRQPVSKASSNGVATISQGALGNEQIGITAGAIWALLSENNEATLASLKKEVDAPADLVLAGIGWLAREEKLQFTPSGRSVKLSLK